MDAEQRHTQRHSILRVQGVIQMLHYYIISIVIIVVVVLLFDGFGRTPLAVLTTVYNHRQ